MSCNSNNPLFKKLRALETQALKINAIEKSDIKTSGEMREEAWECYLVSKVEHLEYMINNKELEMETREEIANA